MKPEINCFYRGIYFQSIDIHKVQDLIQHRQFFLDSIYIFIFKSSMKAKVHNKIRTPTFEYETQKMLKLSKTISIKNFQKLKK